MMHVALADKRIAVPMLLKIKLEVVSRPGVCFSDCNATRLDARISKHLTKKSHFDVIKELQRFYQAEVLIPSPIPPHLIKFPSKPVKLPVKKKALSLKIGFYAESRDWNIENNKESRTSWRTFQDAWSHG